MGKVSLEQNYSRPQRNEPKPKVWPHRMNLQDSMGLQAQQRSNKTMAHMLKLVLIHTSRLVHIKFCLISIQKAVKQPQRLATNQMIPARNVPNVARKRIRKSHSRIAPSATVSNIARGTAKRMISNSTRRSALLWPRPLYRRMHQLDRHLEHLPNPREIREVYKSGNSTLER